MTRKTIDFGIDLGTTNSVMACMDSGELIVVRNQITQSEITPSVVRMDARGTITVGQSAYNELEFDPENTVGEFKRWMGNPQADGFTFKRSNQRMTGSQLSAEVLKALRNSAAARFGGEAVNAALITVPAHFLIPACEETKAAAKLAGIEVGPFIQEPVAAAMAYEYKAESLPGKLMVFDLGGGTFDVSLLCASDGKLLVLGLDGDDKLGGQNYDWALVELIVHRLRQEYGPVPLFGNNPAARRAMATLKTRAEEAKKTLSAVEMWSFEVRNLGAPFEQIDTVVEVSRADLQTATADLTERCLHICLRLLKQCDLSRDDLANVLLVGGQTQMPYIRAAILDAFGKAEYRLDPMTVVAAGAALCASMQRLPRAAKPVAAAGVTSLEVVYQPVVSDEDADVGLWFSPAPVSATVTLLRADGGWSSGAIPVPVSGKLSTGVVLRPKLRNSFEVQLNDARGSRIRLTENQFAITQGLVPPDTTTSRALSVALIDNRIEVLIPKGSSLPFKGTLTFLAAHDVIAGDAKSVLRIHLLEGDYPRADRNIKIGECTLHGNELRRTLLGGESVDISFQLTDDKVLQASAFFPAATLVCPMERTLDRPSLLPHEVVAELRRQRNRLQATRDVSPGSIEPWIGKQILQVEREIDAFESPDGPQAAAQHVLEIEAALDALEEKVADQLLKAKLDHYRDAAHELIVSAGTSEQARTIKSLIQSADGALARKDMDALKPAVEALREAYLDVYWDQDESWEDYFQLLVSETDFVEPRKAERLKEEGKRALRDDDPRALRNAVERLHRLRAGSKLLRLQGELLSPR